MGRLIIEGSAEKLKVVKSRFRSFGLKFFDGDQPLAQLEDHGNDPKVVQLEDALGEANVKIVALEANAQSMQANYDDLITNYDVLKKQLANNDIKTSDEESSKSEAIKEEKPATKPVVRNKGKGKR